MEGSPIHRVAVVGTGTLGTQIAAQAVRHGCTVTAYDPEPAAFEEAVARVLPLVARAQGRTGVSPEAWEEAVRRVRRCADLEAALQGAELVIEAVPEDLALKRQVFAAVDALVSAHVLLATNSSSIPVSRLESAAAHPERCLNLHFYLPALGMDMVDVMGGTRTTAQAMEAAKAWVRAIGCVPLTVHKEVLGFCFNRVWRAVKRETLWLWANGVVDLRDVDRAWMIFTGMDRGPFGLMDSIGLDVVCDIEEVYHQESGDPRDAPPEALRAMVERGELGMKTGRGFYTYPDPEYARPGFLRG
ncbi:MAG: 3-hydroxyacyl-CoA dehydrogenase family protein [Candidatus Latescibacterota bacterium]